MVAARSVTPTRELCQSCYRSNEVIELFNLNQCIVSSFRKCQVVLSSATSLLCLITHHQKELTCLQLLLNV